MKKLLLPLCIVFLATAACKKNKDDKNCDVTAASIAGTYKLSSMKYKLNSSTPEFDAPIQDCQGDDILVLNANLTLAYQDAGTICSPDGSFTGNWSLTGNTIDVELYAGTVESFNCSKLVIVATDVQTPGDKLTATLTRQ